MSYENPTKHGLALFMLHSEAENGRCILPPHFLTLAKEWGFVRDGQMDRAAVTAAAFPEEPKCEEPPR